MINLDVDHLRHALPMSNRAVDARENSSHGALFEADRHVSQPQMSHLSNDQRIANHDFYPSREDESLSYTGGTSTMGNALKTDEDHPSGIYPTEDSTREKHYSVSVDSSLSHSHFSWAKEPFPSASGSHSSIAPFDSFLLKGSNLNWQSSARTSASSTPRDSDSFLLENTRPPSNNPSPHSPFPSPFDAPSLEDRSGWGQIGGGKTTGASSQQQYIGSGRGSEESSSRNAAMGAVQYPSNYAPDYSPEFSADFAAPEYSASAAPGVSPTAAASASGGEFPSSSSNPSSSSRPVQHYASHTHSHSHHPHHSPLHHFPPAAHPYPPHQYPPPPHYPPAHRGPPPGAEPPTSGRGHSHQQQQHHHHHHSHQHHVPPHHRGPVSPHAYLYPPPPHQHQHQHAFPPPPQPHFPPLPPPPPHAAYGYPFPPLHPLHHQCVSPAECGTGRKGGKRKEKKQKKEKSEAENGSAANNNKCKDRAAAEKPKDASGSGSNGTGADGSEKGNKQAPPVPGSHPNEKKILQELLYHSPGPEDLDDSVPPYLFVGNLPKKTTTRSVCTHFSQYGRLLTVKITKSQPPDPLKLFALLKYESEETSKEVLTMQHSMDSKTLFVRIASKGEVENSDVFSGKQEASQVAGPHSKKVFVGGLAPNVTEEVLREHFGKYGEVVDAVIMTTRRNNAPRGFGFVTFATVDAVLQCLQDEHVLCGKRADARISTWGMDGTEESILQTLLPQTALSEANPSESKDKAQERPVESGNDGGGDAKKVESTEKAEASPPVVNTITSSKSITLEKSASSVTHEFEVKETKRDQHYNLNNNKESKHFHRKPTQTSPFGDTNHSLHYPDSIVTPKDFPRVSATSATKSATKPATASSSSHLEAPAPPASAAPAIKYPPLAPATIAPSVNPPLFPPPFPPLAGATIPGAKPLVARLAKDEEDDEDQDSVVSETSLIDDDPLLQSDASVTYPPLIPSNGNASLTILPSNNKNNAHSLDYDHQLNHTQTSALFSNLPTTTHASGSILLDEFQIPLVNEIEYGSEDAIPDLTSSLLDLSFSSIPDVKKQSKKDTRWDGSAVNSAGKSAGGKKQQQAARRKASTSSSSVHNHAAHLPQRQTAASMHSHPNKPFAHSVHDPSRGAMKPTFPSGLSAHYYGSQHSIHYDGMEDPLYVPLQQPSSGRLSAYSMHDAHLVKRTQSMPTVFSRDDETYPSSNAYYDAKMQSLHEKRMHSFHSTNLSHLPPPTFTHAHPHASNPQNPSFYGDSTYPSALSSRYPSHYSLHSSSAYSLTPHPSFFQSEDPISLTATSTATPHATPHTTPSSASFSGISPWAQDASLELEAGAHARYAPPPMASLSGHSGHGNALPKGGYAGDYGQEYARTSRGMPVSGAADLNDTGVGSGLGGGMYSRQVYPPQ